jgi:acetyl esterase/lipase
MKRSVRYVRYHAASFGIDPNKIGITGGSAGGHLSLCVALSDDKPDAEALDPVDRVSSRVQAAAVLYPPTDVMNWGGPGFSVVNAKEFVRARAAWGAIDFREWNDKFKTYDEITDTARRNIIGKEISPATHVSSDDPPVYIIHGDADRVVPLQQSKLIVGLFEKAGVKNRFVIKKGADHAVEDMLEEYKEFVPWFDQWLR